MPKDVNELIADDFIRHTIDLDRFAAGERLRTLTALRELEDELLTKLKGRAKLTNFQAARTEALLQQTQATIAKRYKKIRADRKASLETVYEAEKNFVVQASNNRIGSSVMTVFVDENVTRRAVDGTLINGAPSAQWWTKQATDLQDKFERAVRTGILAGETNDQIARRIRGTKANGFKDGIMEVSRREADALVRTSVQAVANKARQDTFEDNADIIQKVQQRSTLDSRTTNICKSYSGLVWIMKRGPNGVEYIPDGHDKSFANVDRDGVLHYGPPRHWQCRSALVPITASWEDLAGKRIKPKGAKESTFQKRFEERLKKRGFTPDQIKGIKAKTRASMNGQVPVDISYEDWLKTQPENVQIDALGPERWRLWKEGRITNFQQLTDNQGRPLTLDELVKKVDPKKIKKKPTPTEKKQPAEKTTPEPDSTAAAKIDNLNNYPDNFRERFVKVMDGRTDECFKIVNKVPPIKKVWYAEPGQTNGAFYSPSQKGIHLHTSGWSASDQTVVHEYMHYIDDVAGSRGLPGTARSNLRYISDLANEVMEAESKNLIQIAETIREGEIAMEHGSFAWARVMRSQEAKGRKWQLNFLLNSMIDNGLLDEYTYILKNMKRAKPDRIAWVMQQVADADIRLTQSAATKRIAELIEESKTALSEFPPPVRPFMEAFEKAEDKLDFLKTKIDELYAAGEIPLNEDELRLLAPNVDSRARLVQSLLQKDVSEVVRVVAPISDEMGKLRGAVNDYFGSLTKARFGYGHSFDYYEGFERFDTEGKLIREGQLIEMWANYWSLVTQKDMGAAFKKLFRHFTPKTVANFEDLMSKYVKEWGS